MEVLFAFAVLVALAGLAMYVFAWVFGLILGAVFLLLVYTLRAVAIVMGVVAWRLSAIIARVAVLCVGHAVRAAESAALFFAILVSEAWREMAGEQSDDAEAEEDEDEGDDYERACWVLGLEPGFSRKALEAAYRRAIRSAHPDAGGSHDQARALNAARDLIRRRHGWA